MGRVVEKEELIIDLSVVRAGFEEVLRIPMTGGDGLKLWLVNNGTGGTSAEIRCHPAWEAGSAALATLMPIVEANDTISATSIWLSSGTAHMVEVYFGDITAQCWRHYPPYVVIQINEDHTGGTFILGHIITELM